MRIATRLRLFSTATIVVLAVMLPVLAWSYIEFQSAKNDYALVDTIQDNFFARISLRDQYFLYPEDRTRQQWDKNKDALDRLMQQAAAQFQREPDRLVVEQLHRITEDSATIFHRIANNNEVLKRNVGNYPVHEELRKRLSSQLLLKGAATHDRATALQNTVTLRVEQAYACLVIAIALLILTMSLAATLSAVHLGRLIRKRVVPLHEGAGIVAGGDLAYRLACDGSDEFTELAQSINAMTDSLQLSTQALEREIAGRKLIEAALKESEYRWKFAIEGSGDGLWDWNVADGTVFFTRRWKEMLGYTEDEVGNGLDEWEKRVHSDDKADTLATVQNTLDGRSQVYASEHRVLCKDGSYKWILDRGMVVARSEDGTPLRMIGTHVDITERKRVEKELEQYSDHLEQRVFSRTVELAQSRDAAEAASRAKSVFLANMSHELRTPMNAIKGMTDLALRRATDARQINFLTKSTQATGNLLAIISDILDIAEIEADRLTLDEVSFSPTQALDEVLRIQKEQALAKGLCLISEIAAILPDRLCGDPTRLKQIWQKLVGNAIKFSESGQVTVRADTFEEDSSSVLLRIQVVDQGIGMSQEQQGHLFQAFMQVDGSSTRKQGGAGLGLAIAQRLARLMGGDVGVQSEAGIGSTFWMTARLGRCA